MLTRAPLMGSGGSSCTPSKAGARGPHQATPRCTPSTSSSPRRTARLAAVALPQAAGNRAATAAGSGCGGAPSGTVAAATTACPDRRPRCTVPRGGAALGTCSVWGFLRSCALAGRPVRYPVSSCPDPANCCRAKPRHVRHTEATCYVSGELSYSPGHLWLSRGRPGTSAGTEPRWLRVCGAPRWCRQRRSGQRRAALAPALRPRAGARRSISPPEACALARSSAWRSCAAVGATSFHVSRQSSADSAASPARWCKGCPMTSRPPNQRARQALQIWWRADLQFLRSRFVNTIRASALACPCFECMHDGGKCLPGRSAPQTCRRWCGSDDIENWRAR